MTLIISDDGSIVTNNVALNDAPAVLITGNNVTFTNGGGGVVTASAAGSPTISLVGLNSYLINQLSARIEAFDPSADAIFGTASAERVDNHGLISGWVRLGGGADIFNEYYSDASTGVTEVDLGGGDDSYTLHVDTRQSVYNAILGGDGTDSLNLQTNQSVIYGYIFSGFEHLTVGSAVSNLWGFSGYQSISLTPGGFNNFIFSSNPTIDLTLAGNFLTIGPGSTFRNVVGSGQADYLTLRASDLGVGALSGSASLGGGNDVVYLSLFDAGSSNPSVAGTVDGGTGTDYISITSRSTQAVDLANYLNFEELGIGTQALPGTATAHVINANGLLKINTADDVRIGLSNSPNAQFWGAFRGTTTLESTTTIGFVRYEYAPANVAAIETADSQYNMILVNNGIIIGAVELYIGDDIYDGSVGSTGGTIYGYAGNDSLTGGAGAERLEGGFGNDVLRGNGGADWLFGDAGDDVFHVDTADLEINGGAGFDRIVFGGSGSLSASLASIEGVELTAGANLAISSAQLTSGLATNASLTGSGTLTVNMASPGILTTKLLSVANTISLVINGSSGMDIMKLGNAVNSVNAGDGTDQIKGGNLVDTINGGNGVDKINGEGGADILTGGGGNDVFKYGAASDSGVGAAADRITDYQIGQDRLNFARIDTNASLAGDQGFAFIGVGSFTGTGVAQIRYGSSGGDLLVLADINGDGAADMQIILQGLAGQTLTAADFVL